VADRTGRRKPTATSSFGVSRRESHDASGFYERFTPPVVSKDEDVHPHKAIDQLLVGDARAMPEVPDRSVALVVTSPPYFAGKEYEQALGEGHVPGTYLDYLRLLEDVLAECVRTLEPGGRIAVNVANLGRKPYRSLSADVVGILQDRLRLLLRGEVIWQKARGAGGSCAWGSFQRPGNPVLRDLTERVVIASKGRFNRALSPEERQERGLPAAASLSRDEFMEATTDVWDIPSEQATRVGHPAPFPVALPERLIHLFTYEGDLVLDPFVGSGSTAVAAVRTGRHFVGYDTDEGYVRRAEQRVEEARRRNGQPGPGIVLLPSAPNRASNPSDDNDVARALAAGTASREVAEIALRHAGFEALETDVRLAYGLKLAFRARDHDGQLWLFDLAGGFTTLRPGLQRSDVLWKTIGKLAVVRELEPKVPLVLLTTGLPGRGTSLRKALDAVVGIERPITAVIDLSSADDRARLRRWVLDGPPEPVL